MAKKTRRRNLMKSRKTRKQRGGMFNMLRTSKKPPDPRRCCGLKVGDVNNAFVTENAATDVINSGDIRQMYNYGMKGVEEGNKLGLQYINDISNGMISDPIKRKKSKYYNLVIKFWFKKVFELAKKRKKHPTSSISDKKWKGINLYWKKKAAYQLGKMYYERWVKRYRIGGSMDLWFQLKWWLIAADERTDPNERRSELNAVKEGYIKKEDDGSYEYIIQDIPGNVNNYEGHPDAQRLLGEAYLDNSILYGPSFFAVTEEDIGKGELLLRMAFKNGAVFPNEDELFRRTWHKNFEGYARQLYRDELSYSNWKMTFGTRVERKIKRDDFENATWIWQKVTDGKIWGNKNLGFHPQREPVTVMARPVDDVPVAAVDAVSVAAVDDVPVAAVDAVSVAAVDDVPVAVEANGGRRRRRTRRSKKKMRKGKRSRGKRSRGKRSRVKRSKGTRKH